MRGLRGIAGVVVVGIAAIIIVGMIASAVGAAGGELWFGNSGSASGAALQKLAQISGAAADKAALRAVPGSVTGTQLADEQGYVVYDVTVAAKDGQTHEVMVDADNGTVLRQGMAGDNDTDRDGYDGSELPGQRDHRAHRAAGSAEVLALTARGCISACASVARR